jgi:hypothetical protein
MALDYKMLMPFRSCGVIVFSPLFQMELEVQNLVLTVHGLFAAR